MEEIKMKLGIIGSEINCHGGVYITSQVLNVCIKNGARMAEHGEFSKRAFLNGRIDLSQAEAISDIITAKNSYATDLALKGITGNISNFIEELKEDLIQIITQIEVNIDYPEYDDVEHPYFQLYYLFFEFQLYQSY